MFILDNGKDPAQHQCRVEDMLTFFQEMLNGLSECVKNVLSSCIMEPNSEKVSLQEPDAQSYDSDALEITP